MSENSNIYYDIRKKLGLSREKVYFPTGENHLHGLSEPVSRRMRTTLTETVPLNLISNNC